jgi:hypothetical protein
VRGASERSQVPIAASLDDIKTFFCNFLKIREQNCAYFFKTEVKGMDPALDSIRIQGFDDQKLKKYLFYQKWQVTYPYASIKHI